MSVFLNNQMKFMNCQSLCLISFVDIAQPTTDEESSDHEEMDMMRGCRSDNCGVSQAFPESWR